MANLVLGAKSFAIGFESGILSEQLATTEEEHADSQGTHHQAQCVK
jgi:hypothetical protein